MGRGRSAISLFVRNISHKTRPDELRRAFERYGPIKDVYIPKDYYTGEPRGFCFVKYMDARDAEDAKRGLDRTVLDGREIAVMFAEEDRKTPDEMRHREKVYSYSSSSRDRGDRRRSRSRSRSPRKRRSSRSRSRSRSKSPKRSRSSGTRSPRGGKSRSRSYSPAPKKHRASSQSPNYQDHGKDRERERDRSPVEVDPVSESSRYDRGGAESSQPAGNGRPGYDDDA